MRRLVATLLAGALLLTSFSVSAQPTVTVTIDGAQAGEPAPVINATIMVPLRTFATALGAQVVHWDGESALVTRGNRVLQIYPDHATAWLDDRAVELPEPAYLANGRLMVPLTLLAQALRAEVRWNDAAATAEVRTNVGGSITLAALDYIDYYFPFYPTNLIVEPIVSLLYDPLLRPDSQLNLQPALAERYSIEGDRTILFHLRHDVTWHDGRPFTAADVLYSLQIAAHPDSNWNQLPEQIKGLAALLDTYLDLPASLRLDAWEEWRATGAITMRDDYTVAVELSEPYAPAVAAIATMRILPAHLFGGQPPQRDGASWLPPIGTGPYQLREWKSGERIVLRRNRNWRLGAQGQPARIDEIVFRLFPSDAAMTAALQAGLVDVAPLSVTEAHQIRATRTDLQTVAYAGTSYTFLGYDLNDPILGEWEVRTAISLAVDRRQMLEDAVDGHGTLAFGHSLPGRWDSRGLAYPPTYDPEKAAALLESAGWEMGEDGVRVKDGRPLSFEIATNNTEPRRKAAESIQRQLKPLGIDVTVNIMEWVSLLERVLQGKKQAYVLGWNLGTDPDPFLQFHSRGGFHEMHNYQNPAVDHLIELAQRSFHHEERAKYYREIWHLLQQDQVYTWLFFGHYTLGVHERVQGVMTPEIGHVDPRLQVENWWVTD